MDEKTERLLAELRTAQQILRRHQRSPFRALRLGLMLGGAAMAAMGLLHFL